jgi:DNA-binding response OmpR family regulator
MTAERRKILLVDDSELTLLLEAETLTSAGYEVRTADSVVHVQEVLEVWSPDIILTDVKMPDMDGAELCRLIKRQVTRLVPIILFSDLGDEELEALASRCGADGYLSKSHGLDTLARQVEELCESIVW